MSSHAPSFFTRYFFSTNHKDIGVLYLIFAIIAGLIGGIFSLLIRMELQDPGMQILGDDYQKYNVFLAARRRAKRSLWRQKCKTGIGILGKPLRELTEDPKYGAEYEAESLRAGEKLAEASLTAELMVCTLAQAPHKGCTGRGQFPRFLNRPIAPRNVVNNIPSSCPHFRYFSLACKHTDNLIFLLVSLLSSSTPLLSTALHNTCRSWAKRWRRSDKTRQMQLLSVLYLISVGFIMPSKQHTILKTHGINM